MKIIKVLFSLIFALLLVIFALKNNQWVQVHFWPSHLRLEMNLATVIISSFTAGVLCGGLLMWVRHWWLKLKAATKKSQGKERDIDL